MDCGVDNEDEVVKDNIGDMSSTADSKVHNQDGQNSADMDCSAEENELDHSGEYAENKECYESDDGMEGVECSKNDKNSDGIQQANSETKVDTSFNVRNG